MAVILLGKLAFAESAIVVVGHSDTPVTALSRDDVAELFLGKRRTVGEDVAVTPIDSDDSALRERFYQTVAGMTPIRVKAYWSRIVFSGQGRPPPAVPYKEAMARVTSEPEAVAYIRADQVTPAMKVLLTLP